MVSGIIFTQALQTPVAQLQEQSRASQRLAVSSSSVFTITSLEFFSLRSLTLAECSFFFRSLSPLLQVVRKIYFGSCDNGVGGQKTRRWRGGKESKHMMAPIWRFPPLRGNSSGLKLILSCQPWCWKEVYKQAETTQSRSTPTSDTGTTTGCVPTLDWDSHW